ncbi:MAG TPA: RNA-binding protein [Gammaproteobacteria bacterium]|nr:RNA-binding protein [Gammaproteobacteria bacterium]
MQGEVTRVRLDKWLWAARFYRTRALATEAIKGGHVRVNGEPARPSRPLVVGDTLRIRKGSYTWTVVVDALSDRRGPARVAQQLYHETEDSEQARALLREQLRDATPRPARRPDKRMRRHIHRFIRKQAE